MTVFNSATSSHFDWLNSVAQARDDEILEHFSPECVRHLSFLVEYLEDVDALPRTKVERDNFVSITGRMCELYKSGSKDLGETIIHSDELLKTGLSDQAKEVYAAFMRRCKSRFYLDIALTQLNKIRNASTSS